MTQPIDEAMEALRSLPEDLQDTAARAIIDLAAELPDNLDREESRG